MTPAFIVAQPYATWGSDELKLDNGIVQRIIRLPKPGAGNFLMTSCKPHQGSFRYFMDAHTDFQLEVEGKTYSGKSTGSLKNITRHKDTKQGDGGAVALTERNKQSGKPLLEDGDSLFPWVNKGQRLNWCDKLYLG